MSHRVLVASADRGWLDELEGRLHDSAPDLSLDRSSDPREAERLLAAGSHDLLLVDWSLPGATASALIASVADSVPALALVPPADLSAGREALAAGAVDHAPKSEATLAEANHVIARTIRMGLLRGELVALREKDSQIRRLSLHLQSTLENERARMARRIHDDLGQVLTALKMETVWLRRHLPADRHDLIEKATAMVALVGDTIRTVQALCTELRPQMLDDLGIGSALEWLGAEFAHRTGIACSVTIEPQDLTLDREGATAIFRIAQEALHNVERHAGAKSVRASLEHRDQTVVLTVSDDGRGITPAEARSPGAFGLLEIRERLAAFGGSLEVRGDAGTMLSITLPAADQRASEDAPTR